MGVCAVTKAQKYADIYNSLSSKTLDQAYSMLMEYQRSNPRWANTYLQLGMICEKQLLQTDPLRDIQSAQYWADNAKLFFDAFEAFYSENDVRTNSGYYSNLDIPKSGNRVQDADLKVFVEQHRQFCKNFRDSATMVYEALEKSKDYYNRCIGNFKTICDKYNSLNEMLLCYDTQLQGMLDTLEADMDSCVNAFAQYKKLIEAYPIRDYRQTYAFKPIETFRLDGLTNTDFYMEHFTIWDYSKWIDQVEHTFLTDIVPLRQRTTDINQLYEQGRQEYETKSPLVVAKTQAYDDLFVFQLGKYDSNSLVRQLFSYLDNRRQFMLMACDSLAMPTDSSAALLNRKMRHIYRLSEKLTETSTTLDELGHMITAEHVARFADFFAQNYGGLQGLQKYVETEKIFLDAVFGDVLEKFSTYTGLVARQRSRPVYSLRGKGVSVPLWVVSENDLPELKSSYITTCVVYDQQGMPEYVAGFKKNANAVAFVAGINQNGTTAWLTELKDTEQVYDLSANGSGCLVTLRQNGRSAALVINQAGKEIRKINVGDHTAPIVHYDDLTNVAYVACSETDGSITLRRIMDDMQVWTVVLKSFERIATMVEVSDGILVIGYDNGKIVCGRISSNGDILKVNTIGDSGLSLDRIFRASAQDICIFARDAQGKLQLMVVSDTGDVKMTSATH